MKRLFLFSVILVLFCWTNIALSAINETVSVTAKPKDNPQQDEDDIEGHFDQSPDDKKDRIEVTNHNVKYVNSGVYNDPVNDGAMLSLFTQPNPVKVDVEGRKAIGAMYWVTVTPYGPGEGGNGGLLWADVEDIETAGALILKDINSGRGESDSTDDDSVIPTLYCKIAEDKKGDVEFRLETETGTYDWVIKKGTSTFASGTLNDPDYEDSASGLAVDFYSIEVTKQGDQNFKRRIDFGIVSISLFKNNTDWSSDWLLLDTPDLFTLDRITGIQIEGVGTSQTVQVKLWTSEDTSNKPTESLTENPAAVYRNTGTGAWPHYFWEYQAANKRLAITDEDSSLCVMPILSGKEQPHLSISEKVDLAEVAAVDGTDSRDAKAFYDKFTDSTRQWCGIALHEYAQDRIGGTGARCVELGKKVDILNISGHGISSKAEVYGDGRSEEDGGNYGLYIDPLTPSDIGSFWSDADLEWLIMAVCSQLRNDNGSNPTTSDNVVKWIKKMPTVHGLFGYRFGAPGGGTDVNIANRFGNYSTSKTLVLAWMEANFDEGYKPDTNFDPWNAVALVRSDCISDKWKSHNAFPTSDGPTTYIYYWINKDKNNDGTNGDGEIQSYSITIP